MSAHDSKSPATKARVRVLPGQGGWMVRRPGAGPSADIYTTRSEATEAARLALRRSGGELVVLGRDGYYRESMALGRDQMAWISAVDGIHLSPESIRALEDLDSRGASGQERRQWIARQFEKNA